MRALSLVVLVTACSNAANPTPDAPMGVVDASTIDAGPPLGVLVVNEVAPGETPDWFEIVNVTSVAVPLDEYCYVDLAEDFAKCKAFPSMSLAPGAHFAQDVDDLISGFKLASDEAIWIYRIADHRLSDGLDWDDGVAPAGSTFARLPDTTGAFQTTAMPTKGTVNLAVDPTAPLKILVINEVAAGDDPDWIEIVNVTSSPVQLDAFAYVDTANDFVAMKPFPTMTLAPGAYYVQDVSTVISGFSLGSDEDVWIYRIADQRLSDGVDWPAGASPAGSSYARSPDKTGAFAPDATPTRNAANN